MPFSRQRHCREILKLVSGIFVLTLMRFLGVHLWQLLEERNSGRSSGSGEFGADLWVEAMVSALREASVTLVQ